MKVSVIVITYNEENNIRDCLKALTNIDYKDKYEVIVVDASKDNTKKIVQEEFKDVKLVNSDKKGYGFQRNLGIKNSKYDLIAFTDADCIVPSNWLNKLVDNLSDYDCLGGCIKNPESAGLIGRSISCLGFPAGGILGIEFFGSLSTCNSIFKREVFNKIGLFNENLIFGGEDSELMDRVKKSNFKIALKNECFVYHKPRSFNEFLNWSFRRGKARYFLYKNPSHILMFMSVLVYPFTRKFRLLIRKRREIKVNLLNLFTIVIFLFFMRQLFMSLGWIYGAGQDVRRKKKY